MRVQKRIDINRIKCNPRKNKKPSVNSYALGKFEKGAVSAIVVYILLVIVGGLVSASVLMSNASLGGNTEKKDHLQALYLAESALEREIAALNAVVTSCGTFATNQQSYAGGTFETISSIDVGVNPDCLVKVKGAKNSVVTYIEATLFNAGGTGASGGSSSYAEHFPAGSLATWPATEASSEGTSVLDAANNCTTCAGAPSGQSLHFSTTTGGGWNSLDGFRQELLSTVIDTTGGGVTIDFSFGYKKNVTGTTGGVRQRMYLELYDSTNGVTQELWRDIGVSAANVWVPVSQVGVSLTGGRLYDYVRIVYDLRGRAGREPEVWMDEINLNASGGGSPSPNWQTISWDEVDQ